MTVMEAPVIGAREFERLRARFRGALLRPDQLPPPERQHPTEHVRLSNRSGAAPAGPGYLGRARWRQARGQLPAATSLPSSSKA